MLWRIVHEQMHVVYFAVQLDQLRLKVSAYLVEDGVEPMDRVSVKYLLPVFCYKDQVHMKLEYAMSAVPNFT